MMKSKRVAFIEEHEYCQTLNISNEEYVYQPQYPLLSIHLGSNRPHKLIEFVESLEAVTSNKNAYEMNVKIDSEDKAMIECVQGLITTYGKHKIKPLIAPRKEGLWSLWEYYNILLKQANPRAYFYWNPSDEVRIKTKDWDLVLAKYIGFFPDHIFRLKLSDNRLRNYYDIKEIRGTPDNFPFISRKWMEICSTWGDCHSPDVFHQGISFYLGKMNIFRDVAIFDIDLGNIEAGDLLTYKQSRERGIGCGRVWEIAMSKPMLMRYYAHASKLHYCIQAFKIPMNKVTLKDYSKSGNIIGECASHKAIYSYQDDEINKVPGVMRQAIQNLQEFLEQQLSQFIMLTWRSLYKIERIFKKQTS